MVSMNIKFVYISVLKPFFSSDGVPTIPPTSFGYRHQYVYIYFLAVLQNVLKTKCTKRH